MPQVLRALVDMHEHPTSYHDFSKLFDNLAIARSRNLEVVRDYRVLYDDSFPIYQARHGASLHGFYTSSGTLSFFELQKQDNYFGVGQAPKGADIAACYAVWKPDILALQNGIFVEAGPANHRRVIFLHGAVALLKGDYPSAGERRLSGCASKPPRSLYRYPQNAAERPRV
jgi:hypothetical protein